MFVLKYAEKIWYKSAVSLSGDSDYSIVLILNIFYMNCDDTDTDTE